MLAPILSWHSIIYFSVGNIHFNSNFGLYPPSWYNLLGFLPPKCLMCKTFSADLLCYEVPYVWASPPIPLYWRYSFFWTEVGTLPQSGPWISFILEYLTLPLLVTVPLRILTLFQYTPLTGQWISCLHGTCYMNTMQITPLANIGEGWPCHLSLYYGDF